MSRYYRAVAVDYDGTLTETDTPHPDVLAAIRRARGGGRLVVLVTGRILDSLLTSFPEAELAFDAIVGENGGVIWLPGKGRRAVAQPVAGELDAALAARGVPVERGSVLLATQAAYDHVVLEEITRRGLDVQPVRNRGALMLLPRAYRKGPGCSRPSPSSASRATVPSPSATRRTTTPWWRAANSGSQWPMRCPPSSRTPMWCSGRGPDGA